MYLKIKNNYKIYLFISFLFISCAEIIFVDDISNDNVTIITPQDGVTIQDSTVTFSWNVIKGAESYRIQTVTPNFNQVTSLLLDSVIVNTQHTMRIDLKFINFI